MQKERRARFIVEGLPAGCLERNMTIRARSKAEALALATWMIGTSRVPAVRVTDRQKGASLWIAG